jgi:hypothetical protein
MTFEEAMQLFAPKFDWLDVQPERVRIRPGERGLTLGSLNVGSYAVVPDRWTYDTFLPRGAKPPETRQAGLGYTIFDKEDVWSDQAADLYEESIAKRWVPAKDIPWETLLPLPDEIERAMCQLCTELAQRASTWHTVIAGWLPQISYGFHEVKCMLAAHVFEAGRLYEAFRKRALANGGGLGVESPGIFGKRLTDPRTFLEMSVGLHIVDATFTETLLRHAATFAHNEAEQKLFTLAAQDAARFADYGVSHLRYLLEHNPERRSEVEAALRFAEAALARDEQKNVPLREALIILLGNGLENVSAGWQRLQELRAEQVRRYLKRLAEAGVTDWEEHLNPVLQRWLPAPAAT